MNRNICVLALSVAGLSVFGATPADDLPEPENTRRPLTTFDLLRLNDIGGTFGRGLSVSPDGQYVAFEMHQADSLSNSYRVAWYIASTKEGLRPINVGDGGDPTLFQHRSDDGRVNGSWLSEPAKWTHDSQCIVYRRKEQGEIQIWAGCHDGRPPEQMTHNEGDVLQFKWSEDQSKIYYTATEPRKVLMQTAIRETKRGYLFDGIDPWSLWDAQPIQPLVPVPTVWVYDWLAKEERIATLDEEKEYASIGRFQTPPDEGNRDIRLAARPANGGWAWAEPANSTQRGIAPPLTLYASISPDGTNPVQCAARECTGTLDVTGYGFRLLADGILWDEDGRELYFARREENSLRRRTLYAWNTTTNHLRRIISTYDWMSDCARSRGHIICYRQTSVHPRTIVSIDLNDGKMRTLFDPNPEFRTLSLGEVRRLELQDSHGHAVYGDLVLPTGYKPDQRYPLILVGYSSAHTVRGGTGDEYPVHVFANNGFAVFTYNVHQDWEAIATLPDATSLDAKNWGDDLVELDESIEMISRVVAHLDEKEIIDPTRVGATGFSTGASYVAYSMIHSDLFAAASLSSIQWAPIGFYLTPSGKQYRDYLTWLGFGPQAQKWEKVSLSLNVEKINVPILINAADSEHYGAMQDATSLADAGKPFEMFVYSNEYHVKWQPAHRYYIYERNVDWFNFWLRCMEDPSPEKRDQYVRWRAYRKTYLASRTTTVDEHGQYLGNCSTM
jgi:dienelactone hydrolase